ncbi:MAG: hypothetical protein WBB70_02640, partial [Desulfobacterales bacterium]
SVQVQIVWVSEGGAGQLTAPKKMYYTAFPTDVGSGFWEDTDPSRTVEEIFHDFAIDPNFKLMNSDDQIAPLQKKAVYMKPECSVYPPPTGSGASGNWTGIFSETSVLVE